MNILIKGVELAGVTAEEIAGVLAHAHRAFSGVTVVFQEAEAKVEEAVAAVDTVPAHVHEELKSLVARVKEEAESVVGAFREGWSKITGALGMEENTHPDDVVAAIREMQKPPVGDPPASGDGEGNGYTPKAAAAEGQPPKSE